MSKINWSAGNRRGRVVFVVLTAMLVLSLITVPSLAITHGEPDGMDHPNVGSIVGYIPGPDGGMFQFCSGTLISETVFLTASHCTAGMDSFVNAYEGAQILVTFDPTIEQSGTFYTGTWYTNPNYNGFYGQYGSSDPGDVGVIVLDESPGITPARLPAAGMLDAMKDAHLLKDTRFTTVGYGGVRDSHQGGFQQILDNVDRNRAEQGYLSMTKAWLQLSMNPNTGSGGTCYGDSGGPHFIHLDGVESDIVVSITVTGDAPCKATDRTYRMDSESARSFLAGFVELP